MEPMDAKEEVRSRLAIEDVIGEYVPLKRAGRSWKGLSPFADEKTPSFFVSPDKQIWHDFSSNKGGDVFSFVMEVEGLDFRGALELLARKAGVDLSLYQSAGSADLAQKKRRLLATLDMAATYYQRCLIATDMAIDYVSKRRKITSHTTLDFRLGYAPESGQALGRFLRSKGYTDRELHEAGLLSSRGDMFRGRMMVPLADGQGQVIGFTARLLADTKNAPKYINTPQTLLYDKSRHVYGLHLAKEAIRRADYVVIVEGNLDVISSHQAGVRQVVATAGTALTEHHLRALSRLTRNVRLAFDGDVAGLAATERAIPIAQRVGVELSIVTLPADFKDPDELIQHDPAAWLAALESPQPVVEWVIGRYQARHDPATASGKRQLTSAALQVITLLEDAVEREHYLKQLSEITGASLGALADKLQTINETPSDSPRLKQVKTAPHPAGTDVYGSQDMLLGLAALDPALRDVLRQVLRDDISGEERQQLYDYLVDSTDRFDVENISQRLRPIETYVKIALFKAETRYENIDSSERMIEAARLVRIIQHEKRQSMKRQLLGELRQAEQTGDEPRLLALRTHLSQLIKEEKRAN